MTALTYFRRAEDDVPLFAVLADEASAEYLWPEGTEPWFGNDRINSLLELSDEAPTDEEGWSRLAAAGLESESILADPTESDLGDLEETRDAAEAYLNEEYRTPQERPTAVSQAGGQAYDQISQDYPDFAQTDEDLDPEAMLNFVLMTLGPIDPEGPNGWILRAADGNPRDGDENEWVHLTSDPAPAVGSTSSVEED
jgi:hypothetical protein